MDRKALLQMILCSVLWSIAGICIKLIDCNPMVIAGLRSLFASVTIFVFMKISKKTFLFNKKVMISALFMCFSFICFILANKMTTSANAIVLQYTQPVFIVIISALLFKKRFIKADLITITITLFGIVLFFFDKLDAGQAVGNIIAVCSGLLLAFLFSFMGEVSNAERMNVVLFGHAFTAVIGVPFIFFTNNSFDLSNLLLILVLGIFQIGIPYILFALAVGKCSPLMCSLIGIIEPILNPLWVALFYGEMPGVMSLFGGVLVVVTITVWCLYKNKYALEE